MPRIYVSKLKLVATVRLDSKQQRSHAEQIWIGCVAQSSSSWAEVSFG